MNFRINKIRKEAQAAASGSGGSESTTNETEAATKSGSTSPTRAYVPRKKLEKLNYKVGASILEFYKERNREKLEEAAIKPLEIIQSKKLDQLDFNCNLFNCLFFFLVPKVETTATTSQKINESVRKSTSKLNETETGAGGGEVDGGDKQRLLKPDNVKTITETSGGGGSSSGSGAGASATGPFNKSTKKQSKLKKVVYI